MLISTLVLALAPPLWQAPEARTVSSSIDRVTVYGRQALVERSFRVQVGAAGSETLVLGPFPLAADSASFQVKIDRGNAQIRGLEVQRSLGFELVGAARDSLTAELDGLLAERREFDAKLAEIDAGSAFVDSIIRSLGNSDAATKPREASMAEELMPLFEFVKTRSGELERERNGVLAQTDKLDAKIDELDRRLNGTGESEEEIKVARLTLGFDRPGEVRVDLSYLVDGASWKPTYDVRVAPDLTGVTVGLVAQIAQESGEDWDGAQVLLSTSRPHVGLSPPEVPLRIFEMPRFRRGLAEDQLNSLAQPGTLPGIGPPLLGPDVDYGFTTQFLLPERKTIRANGDAHRFLIREVPLRVHPERFVVPSRSNKAYLRAEVTLSGDAPLLPGSANVFLGPDFLGEASLPTMRPGDSTTIHLGTDPNLRVEWEVLTDERDDPGFLASTVQLTRVYLARLTLAASAPGPIDVVVQEGIPVSRDDRVEVTPTSVQPSPVRTEAARQRQVERGLFEWRLRLSPGETQNIRWGYTASFDEELSPVLTEE